MRGLRLIRITIATFIAATLLLASHTPVDAAPRKRKRKSDAAHVITIDLSSLSLAGDPTLTLSLPQDLWRAHLPRMLKYPRKNQLTASAGKRVASRWLQATPADGRAFNAQVFLVVQSTELGTARAWARRIANESDTVFPFEDARFDGPWIVKEQNFRLAAKKRLRGVQMENSGGRVGENYRSVWQFAVLPMRGEFSALLGVKRRAPTPWAPGKGGPPQAGGAGIGGGGGLGSSGDGSGATPGSGGTGDGTLDAGVGGSGDLGNVNTEPDSNQVRASSELFRSLIAGVHLAENKKLSKGTRRFQLRDEWDSARGLTSRYVGISVPATWRSTPTTALQGDRIEWTERDDRGAITMVARVEFIGANASPPIASHARPRLADWNVHDVAFEDVETRDRTSTAALCTTPITAPQGLRPGDDTSWVREIGYVMAESTFYEVEIIHPADGKSRLDTLRAMLESVEIAVAY